MNKNFLEVPTECRKFVNCRFTFSLYDNESVCCDLISNESTLLGNMTVAGPVYEDLAFMYIKAIPMTDILMNTLVASDILRSCVKIVLNEQPVYRCILTDGYNPIPMIRRSQQVMYAYA